MKSIISLEEEKEKSALQSWAAVQRPITAVNIQISPGRFIRCNQKYLHMRAALTNGDVRLRRTESHFDVGGNRLSAGKMRGGLGSKAINCQEE